MIRVLLLNDLGGCPRIITTDSADVAWEVDEINSSAVDLGLANATDCPEPARFYLWEGERIESREGPEYDVVYKGSIRPLELEEVEEHLAMLPPDDTDYPEVI